MVVIKTTLIHLPSPFLVDDKVFPSLGLIHAATVLGLDIVDLAGDKNYMKQVEKLRGDSFGISSTTPQFPIALEVAETLRKNNPDAKLILGGPHATMMYGRTADKNYDVLRSFDHVVAGDIDQKLTLDRWYIKTPLVRDIDSIPIPDRSKVDIRSYKSEIGGKPSVSLMTQRGCPFDCSFCCGRGIEKYKAIRQHSPQRVADEMKYLNDSFGFSAFMWYDDEININPERLGEISRLIKDRGYSHKGFVRADLLVKHPGSLVDLADMGFRELCFGLESADQGILKNVNKRITVEQTYQAADLIRDAGLRYKVFVMIGLPGETRQTVERTKDWLRQMNPDSSSVFTYCPYPGSRIYDNAIQTDEMPGYDYKYGDFYFNKLDFSRVSSSFYVGNASSTRTKELTSDDIQQLRREVMECASL